MATHSFDSVNIWQIDFAANAKTLDVKFKQSI
jgi:U3 small nucleolar RNA-associated protein 12